MIVAGTGHRPEKLGGYSVEVEEALRTFAFCHLDRLRPARVISGMALGWDQALAQAAIDLGIPLTAAVPFKGFGSKWPKSASYRCTALLCRADQVEVISETPGSRALQLRNEWMVDRADLMLALWDGSWGGTFNCLQYAEKKGAAIENLWTLWQQARDPEILV